MNQVISKESNLILEEDIQKKLHTSALWRYGMTFVLFGVILGIALLFRQYEIKISLTIPVLAGLVLAAWYGGRGPGIFLAVLLVIATIAITPVSRNVTIPSLIFAYFSAFVLVLFIVFLISGRKAAEMRLRDQGEQLLLLNETLEQRVAERTRELGESEARYSMLFNSMLEGFCIIEMIFDEDEKPVDYRFLELNPSFEKHTGLGDAVGKRMRELAPEHEEHWFETYGRIAVTGEPARFINHAQQLNRWYDLYAWRIGDPKNRQVAVVFRDITEQTLADASIAQLNSELQGHAKQLEGANKELESFSYSISHDLRAPLRHIDGFVQLLAKREAERLEGASLHYLDVISAAAGKMGLLIDELLAFSRTSRQELRTGPVDLNTLIKQSQNELASATAGRAIKWEIAPLPAVDADATLLGLVMTNLLSNAIKYTRKRDEARIEIGVQDSADGHATVFVRDNGAGFDMKYADKLFGVFQRLHREDEFEGVGIGLATVQRIVNRHGGRIWAESEPDQGATFCFTLKQAKGDTK